MVTSGLSVPINTPGAAQSTSRIAALGRSVRGLTSPLLGGGLLTGLLGGSLLSLALSGGTASNAMIRFQDILETLFAPVGQLSNQFLDWFEQLPTGVQRLFAISAAIGGVALAARGLGLFALFTSIFNAIKKATVALWGFITAQRVSSRIPPPITGRLPLGAGAGAGAGAAAGLAGVGVGSVIAGGLAGAGGQALQTVNTAQQFQQGNNLSGLLGGINLLGGFANPIGGLVNLAGNAPGLVGGAVGDVRRSLLGIGGDDANRPTASQGQVTNQYNQTIYSVYPEISQQVLQDANLQARLNGGF